jgi:hypothetical protein
MENSQQKHFYMVYLEGERTPAFKHKSMESAEQEAKRLAKAYSKKAFVLCSVKSFELNEFTVKDCMPNPGELPF